MRVKYAYPVLCDPVSAIRFHGTRTGNRIRAKIIVTIKNGGTFCSD